MATAPISRRKAALLLTALLLTMPIGDVSAVPDQNANVAAEARRALNAQGATACRGLAALRPERCDAMLGGIIFAIGLAGLMCFGPSTTARAAQNGNHSGHRVAPPLPPPRPASLSPQPKLKLDMHVKNGPPPGADPMTAYFAADMPQKLPPASRAQIDRCGRAWQKMKASGAAADKTWLTFASVCLVREVKN